MIALPPEDRSLSPHTGWTRAHWAAVADGLLAALEPYWSDDHAEVRLPGRASVSGCDGLEGFARTFLLAAFRVAGGGPPELLTPYRLGLAAGPKVWQPITDRTQPMVEAASIAIGLWLTREHLWDTLDPAVRAGVTDWLSGALRHEPVDNNWWLFPVMVGGFLGDEPAVRRGLDRIEGWYLGGGWYSDGANRSFDHYNGWAMHLYPVLLHHLAATRPTVPVPGLPAEVYGERLGEYLRGYALMFDHGGGMLYHGRSVTYRFASAAPLFAGELAGASPLSPGQTRGLASSVLRHFLDRGALSAEGLLTLGWYGPHEPSLQGYSGSASPYWASKAFLGLLLPPGHPVWTATEELGPTGVAALPEPGFVVHNTGAVARVINHGSQHHVGDPLYDRYAYSTRTGPTTEVPDNHFGVVAADGTVPPRGLIVPRGAGQSGELAWAASVSAAGAVSAGKAGVSATGEAGVSAAGEGGVESLSVVRGAVEVRVHRVPVGSAVRQTGWAIPAPATTNLPIPATTDLPVPAATDLPGAARISLRAANGLVSHLVGLHGYTAASVAEDPAGTAFGAPALVPQLDGTATDGWAVAAAILGDDPAGLPTVTTNPADPDRDTVTTTTARTDPHRETVTLVWPDGLTETFAVTGPTPRRAT
ncbi:DUF2264 domain-containing protein [Nonomuraea sp. NPDC050328]|uniref:DUF2264 domain-containing protein n=1 Tax=Nonomuraea sp. NPDC050328 TaxID=3364361 RepID=UPI0037B13D5A